MLERFLAAAERGDLGALEEMLAKDAVLYADSGGKAMAPPEPLVGAALIARFMAAVALARVRSGDVDAQELATLVRRAREAGDRTASRREPRSRVELRVWSVLTVDVIAGRIQAVRIVRNPDKLGHL